MSFKVTGMSAGAVREYRERTGASMMEGKRHVRRELFRVQFADWRSKATLAEKVEFLLDEVAEAEL